MTQHGFIEDDKKAVDAYKDKYKHTWTSILGSEEFTVYEEPEVGEDLRDILPNEEL